MIGRAGGFRIKICGLRHADHVAAAVEAGADAIGLVLAPSVRQVTPDEAGRLLEGVPDHVARFAVFRTPDAGVLSEICGLPFTALQGSAGWRGTPPAGWDWVPAYGSGVAVPARSRTSGAPARWTRGLILVDGPGDAGAGVTGDWAWARDVARRWPLLLAGGLSPENVAHAINTVRPLGVDVSSGVERRRGVKDTARITRFVAIARAAADALT